MESYWPTPIAIENDPLVANLLNSLPKMVFSTTLDKAGWNNSKPVKENIDGEISKLKQLPGKDIAIFGSSALAASLMKPITTPGQPEYWFFTNVKQVI